MKKLLLLVLLTSMFGTAHATRSRMNSLGQDPNQGSFYLMDNRNFFRNPANTGKMRNFMVAELANGNTETGTGNNLEGGYFGELGSDMAFGVYLGKQAVAIDAFASVLQLTAVNPSPTSGESPWPSSADANPLNLFLGGGSDMKWGINLNYAGSENETANGKQEFSGFGLAAGIETSGGLQVYASYLTDESKNPTSTDYNKLESSPLTVGVIYALNPETTIFGQFGTGETKVTGGGKAEQKFDSSQIIVGVGRIYELSPTARFNFDLSYYMLESENKSPNTAIGSGMITKYSESTLPLVIGLEADAAEWLILRASIQQNFLLGDYETIRATSAGGATKSTVKESATFGTLVNIGGTLHFGKLKIDGNLGSGSDGDQGATALFDTNSFFGQAAVTYMF